jgi:acetyltransferase-like isoleucine patch superfamily enzyme
VPPGKLAVGVPARIREIRKPDEAASPGTDAALPDGAAG